MTGRSKLDQIHVIKQLTQKSHEFDKDIYLLLVDFKEAYDPVNRERLWIVMDHLRIKGPMVQVNGTRKDCRNDSSICTWVDIQSTVRRGEVRRNQC